MKLNLERLEQLKLELYGGRLPHNHDNHDNHEPMGLQIIMEAIRGYLYNDHQNEIITKLLTDYGVLVEETEDHIPIVKPHKFNIDG